MGIFPHFLCVPNLRFGVWFAGGAGAHQDIKLACNAGNADKAILHL